MQDSIQNSLSEEQFSKILEKINLLIFRENDKENLNLIISIMNKMLKVSNNENINQKMVPISENLCSKFYSENIKLNDSLIELMKQIIPLFNHTNIAQYTSYQNLLSFITFVIIIECGNSEVLPPILMNLTKREIKITSDLLISNKNYINGGRIINVISVFRNCSESLLNLLIVLNEVLTTVDISEISNFCQIQTYEFDFDQLEKNFSTYPRIIILMNSFSKLVKSEKIFSLSVSAKNILIVLNRIILSNFKTDEQKKLINYLECLKTNTQIVENEYIWENILISLNCSTFSLINYISQKNKLIHKQEIELRIKICKTLVDILKINSKKYNLMKSKLWLAKNCLIFINNFQKDIKSENLIDSSTSHKLFLSIQTYFKKCLSKENGFIERIKPSFKRIFDFIKDGNLFKYLQLNNNSNDFNNERIFIISNISNVLSGVLKLSELFQHDILNSEMNDISFQLFASLLSFIDHSTSTSLADPNYSNFMDLIEFLNKQSKYFMKQKDYTKYLSLVELASNFGLTHEFFVSIKDFLYDMQDYIRIASIFFLLRKNYLALVKEMQLSFKDWFYLLFLIFKEQNSTIKEEFKKEILLQFISVLKFNKIISSEKEMQKENYYLILIIKLLISEIHQENPSNIFSISILLKNIFDYIESKNLNIKFLKKEVFEKNNNCLTLDNFQHEMLSSLCSILSTSTENLMQVQTKTNSQNYLILSLCEVFGDDLNNSIFVLIHKVLSNQKSLNNLNKIEEEDSDNEDQDEEDQIEESNQLLNSINSIFEIIVFVSKYDSNMLFSVVDCFKSIGTILGNKNKQNSSNKSLKLFSSFEIEFISKIGKNLIELINTKNLKCQKEVVNKQVILIEWAINECYYKKGISNLIIQLKPFNIKKSKSEK